MAIVDKVIDAVGNVASSLNPNLEGLLGDPYKSKDYENKQVASPEVNISTKSGAQKPLEGTAPEMGEYQMMKERVKATNEIELKGAKPLFQNDLSSGYISEYEEPKQRQPRAAYNFDDAPAPAANPDQVRNAMFESLKAHENPEQAGFKNGEWFPTPDLGDRSATGQMIGYGVSVQPEWLKDDSAGWPTIDGMKVDVRQGISQHQAQRLMEQAANDNVKPITEIKQWDKLAPEVQGYFTDLAYNVGGDYFMNSMPNAKAALENGHPIDSMIHTFSAMNITENGKKKPMRGLLNRRLNAYNKMAQSLGQPKVVSYDWGDGKVKVHFDRKLTQGVEKYQGKKAVTLRSRGVLDASTTYTSEGGLFK